ncbi:MAG: GNAT family N-acetyltransferase [Pseudomonadales bacterium]|nr:GNAT family N-acetyltransferase [Pseudomonadales bacterium]
MNIRPFRDADFSEVLDIYANSKLDELRFESEAFKLLPLNEDEIRLAELRESDIYVYEDEGVMGYSALCGSEIRALFVCPSARGKGIGKGLLEFMLLKVTGTVSLYVAKTNAPAKQLYNNFGFIITDEFDTTYNGVPVLANKMVRSGING